MTPEILAAIITTIGAIVVALISREASRRSHRSTETSEQVDLLDTSTLGVSIACNDRMAASKFSFRVLDLCSHYGISNEVQDAFQTVYEELVANATEHGCAKPTEKYSIKILINRHIIQLTVTNPPGRRFLVEHELERKRDEFAEDRRWRRGRGLLLVSDVADVLSPTSDDLGIEVWIFSQRVELRATILEDLLLLRIASGLRNPSLSRRVVSVLRKHPSNDALILVDGSEPRQKEKSETRKQRGTPSTVLVSKLIDLSDVGGTHDRRLVIVSAINTALPLDMTARSIEDGLEKLRRKHLLKQVNQEFSE